MLEAIDQIFAERFGDNLFLAALLNAAREGHLSLYIDEEAIFPSFGALDARIRSQATPIENLVVKEGKHYYLQRNWNLQQRFLHHFKRITSQNVEPIPIADDPTMDLEQIEAVRTALTHPLTIISGGPGTGKTFIAKKIIASFPGSFAIAAPTGKAAANLRQLANTSTLHALLAKRRVLPYDLIVVDEGSMIDAELMTNLFTHVRDGGRLVILGDRDQLPPIDTGHFFADLTQMAPCCYLNKCHRTELQEIVEMAQKIKRGEMIPYEPLENFVDKPEDVTLLTPLRRGFHGVERLNERFYRADRPLPIIITENASGLVNGETGFLKDGMAFGMREEMLPKYEYAYALSVHKSQGSEYDRVWLLLPPGSERFGREMLYTAITRARKEIRVFAQEGVLERCLQRVHSRASPHVL